jgi:hypothetical protein
MQITFLFSPIRDRQESILLALMPLRDKTLRQSRFIKIGSK